MKKSIKKLGKKIEKKELKNVKGGTGDRHVGAGQVTEIIE